MGSHLLAELHTFIKWIKPESVKIYVGNWFVQANFRVDDLNILWYFKMVEDSFLLIAVFFAGASQAFSKNYQSFLLWQRYSTRLYAIWVIYFCYHFFDLTMFIYNYKTSYVLYVFVVCLVTISTGIIAFVSKKHVMKGEESNKFVA